jgi:hypothetical protein
MRNGYALTRATSPGSSGSTSTEGQRPDSLRSRVTSVAPLAWAKAARSSSVHRLWLLSSRAEIARQMCRRRALAERPNDGLDYHV